MIVKKNKINILLCTNNKESTDKMTQVIEHLDYILSSIPLSIEKMLDFIKYENPHIVMIDVQQGHEIESRAIGLDLLKHKSVPFMFLMSHKEALNVENLMATHPHGFILKSFNSNEIKLAISVALDNFGKKNYQDFLKVKEGNLYKMIDLKDILYIKADDNYLEIHTNNKKYIRRMCLKNLLKKLCFKGFIRVHRSFIVNKKYILNVHFNKVNISGMMIPVSRNYRHNLKKPMAINF
jgi:DNA-binding LytR/AlgR family response regulator